MKGLQQRVQDPPLQLRGEGLSVFLASVGTTRWAPSCFGQGQGCWGALSRPAALLG